MKDAIARLARDGQVRDAYTPGEVTSLRNAGWSPVIVGEAGPAPVAIAEDVAALSQDETSTALQPETKRSHRKRKDDQ